MQGRTGIRVQVENNDLFACCSGNCVPARISHAGTLHERFTIGWNFATSGSSNLHIFNNKIAALSSTDVSSFVNAIRPELTP